MDNPVFVIGSGRSGTTILDRSLGQHPSLVSFPFEPQLFSRSDLSVGIYQLLGSVSADIEKIKKYLHNRYSFKTRQGEEMGFCQWHNRPDYEQLVNQFIAHCEECPESTPEHARNFLNEVYNPYLDSQKASSWVDGSPVNGRIIPQIVKVYPGAYFLHIIRDGRDVARSFARLGWSYGSYEVAAQFWACQVRVTRNLGKEFAPDRYMEVKFEDFVEYPESIMTKIANFVQIDYVPEMVSLINAKRASRYASDYSPWENKYVYAIAPELVEEFGWKF